MTDPELGGDEFVTRRIKALAAIEQAPSADYFSELSARIRRRELGLEILTVLAALTTVALPAFLEIGFGAGAALVSREDGQGSSEGESK